LSITKFKKLDLIFKLLIGVDLFAMLIIFIHARIWETFPFPYLGGRLNNPFMYLLILLGLRGWVNPDFREKQLALIERVTTEEPIRNYFFSLLLVVQFGLQVMWFLYPEDFFWNLNAEKGYGTLFATAQLFLLGIIVLITARVDYGDEAKWGDKIPWFFVAFVYFFIGLDDCVGIHENFISIGGKLILDSKIFHFIHEWLWFYAPIALLVAVFLVRFFLKRFYYSPKLMGIMFIALALWIAVLILEALSKNVVDPLSYDYTRILIGIEEGFEMLGATFFMIGFSRHLKNINEKLSD
tara:strand:- start:581 stop:1468 length:888 start_codon:yes stop_codon:yes gene_type:complete